MAGKRVVARLGGLLALLALCVALFVVPSAYAIANGKPHWFAWAVGLLAFPLIPLVWNVLAERKRASSPKATTTRWERITMRTVFVGVVVIGGLFGIGRGKTWRAVIDHGQWPIPYTPKALVPDSALLHRIPSTAKGVLWLRDTEVSQGLISEYASLGAPGDFELVIASDGVNVYITERGDIHFVELMAQAKQIGWLHMTSYFAGDVHTLPDGSRVWSTPGFAGGSTPPLALLDQLRRAPDDAFLVVAARNIDEVASAVGWIGGRDGDLELAGELVAKTEASAKQFVSEEEREVPKKARELACWGESNGTSSLVRDGATLRARATIPVAEIRALFLCLDLQK